MIPFFTGITNRDLAHGQPTVRPSNAANMLLGGRRNCWFLEKDVARRQQMGNTFGAPFAFTPPS